MPLLVLLFGLALLGIVLARLMKIPEIVGILILGVALKVYVSVSGQSFLPVENVNQLANVGVTFLLFLVGLEFNVKGLGSLKKVCFLGAGIQILVSMLLGVLVMSLIGVDGVAGLIMSAGFSLSSTAVVVKFLMEKNRTQSLPGRILIGWLLVQDLAVIPIMLVMPLLGGNVSLGENAIWLVLLIVVLALLVSFTEKVFDLLARLKEKEALSLAAAAMALGIGLLFEKAGLSLALGGFVAGVILSSSSEKHEIFARMAALHDLFGGIFFLSLGFMVDPMLIIAYWKQILLLVLVFGMIKFAVTFSELLVWGFHTKVAAGVALGLFEAGEFAFVIGQIGFDKGLLESWQLTVMTSVVIFSMILLPMVGELEELVIKIIHPVLSKARLFSFKEGLDAVSEKGKISDHVVLLGYGRMGQLIGEQLLKQNDGERLVVVDYDLNIVKDLRSRGVRSIYGDVQEKEVLEGAAIGEAGTVVVAIPDIKISKRVIRQVKEINPDIYIIARAHRHDDKEQMKREGASRVVLVEESVGRLMYSYLKSRL